MNKKSCKYWNGTIEKQCKKGIDWRKEYGNAVMCIGNKDPKSNCFTLRTPEEIKEEEEAIEKAVQASMKQFKTGLSSCCNAPIDKSRVIKTGVHKGHGPRYCSKCKQCLFLV